MNTRSKKGKENLHRPSFAAHLVKIGLSGIVVMSPEKDGICPKHWRMTQPGNCFKDKKKTHNIRNENLSQGSSWVRVVTGQNYYILLNDGLRQILWFCV